MEKKKEEGEEVDGRVGEIIYIRGLVCVCL